MQKKWGEVRARGPSAREGIVVISSDLQIKGVARFLCLVTKGVAEVFSVDLIFRLGDF